jgi:hypothetical protein
MDRDAVEMPYVDRMNKKYRRDAPKQMLLNGSSACNSSNSTWVESLIRNNTKRNCDLVNFHRDVVI